MSSFVIDKNPLDEVHSVNTEVGYFQFTNKEIFQYLEESGFDIYNLDRMVPLHGKPPVFLGKFSGCPLLLKWNGEFVLNHSKDPLLTKKHAESLHGSDSDWVLPCDRVEEAPPPLVPLVDDEEEPCPHDYLVFDRQGENKYWCKICDERFPCHPEDIVAELVPLQSLSVSIEEVLNGAKTLGEAAAAAAVSAEKLSSTIQTTFRTDFYKMDQGDYSALETRQSAPINIDGYFSNISMDELLSQEYTKWYPDISIVTPLVEENKFMEWGTQFLIVRFIDGTIQKVKHVADRTRIISTA